MIPENLKQTEPFMVKVLDDYVERILSDRYTDPQPQKITVIGGRGRMGQLFVQQLSTAGHNVSILGSNGWDDADTLSTLR